MNCTLRFENAANQLQPATTVECTYRCDGYSVRLVPRPSNEQGRVQLHVPMNEGRAIQYRAVNKDMLVIAGEVDVPKPGTNWPEEVITFVK